MLELLFTRRFSMGHRLISGAAETCALPHGHNELVAVRLRPLEARPLDGTVNMLVPFERAKARWHRFVDERLDHALQLSEADPLLDWFRANEPDRARRIVVTPGDPTTELMACLLMAKLDALLADDDSPLRCAELRLEETPTNAVVLSGPAQELLPTPRPPQACWWRRPDMSVA